MGATQSSTEAAESPTSSSRGLGLGAVGDAVDRWFDVSTDYVCGPNSCSCLLDDGADGSFTVSQASITVVSADGRTDTFGPADEPSRRGEQPSGTLEIGAGARPTLSLPQGF